MPDLQSTNRTKLNKVREATFGVIPTSPAFKEVRNTGSPFKANIATVVSNEIREDRQLTDLILVGQQAGGDVSGELSFRTMDDDLEEALQGTWSVKAYLENLNADTEISDVGTAVIAVIGGGTAFKTGHVVKLTGFGTAANNKNARVTSSTGTTVTFPAATFTAEAAVPLGASLRVIGFQGASGDLVATVTGGNAITSTALDFTTLGLNVGDWVKIGDGVAGNSFATAALNDWVRISAIAATRLSFDIVPTGWAADAGTGKTLIVFAGDTLRNGSTKRSNTFERQYLDHSPTTYEYISGMTLNQMTLALAAQGILTVTKSYLGKITAIGTSRASGATDTAAPTSEVMNTSQDVADISLDGLAITGPNFVMNFSIIINNNLRQQNAIGSLGPVGIGNGEFNVTLQPLQTYFGDKNLYDKVLANTDFGFKTRVKAPNSTESYIFDLPRCEFQSGDPSVSGKNADVMLEGGAQAMRHATLGYTMGINRYWYLPS